MQHIAYHASMDLAGFFCMPQNDLHGYMQHDGLLAGSLDDDMAAAAAGPYSSNGGCGVDVAGAAIGSQAQARHGGRGGGGGGDERKRRRLASNRESARRSRVRKQRRLDELSSRVAQLRAANQRLLVDLNRVIAGHARVARENAKLREEASDLRKRKRLAEMAAQEAEADAAMAPELA